MGKVYDWFEERLEVQAIAAGAPWPSGAPPVGVWVVVAGWRREWWE